MRKKDLLVLLLASTCMFSCSQNAPKDSSSVNQEASTSISNEENLSSTNSMNSSLSEEESSTVISSNDSSSSEEESSSLAEVEITWYSLANENVAIDLSTNTFAVDFVKEALQASSVSNYSKVYLDKNGLKLGSSKAQGNITITLPNAVDKCYVKAVQYSNEYDSYETGAPVHTISVDPSSLTINNVTLDFVAPEANTLPEETILEYSFASSTSLTIHSNEIVKEIEGFPTTFPGRVIIYSIGFTK